jgi:hypothetical protein
MRVSKICKLHLDYKMGHSLIRWVRHALMAAD